MFEDLDSSDEEKEKQPETCAGFTVDTPVVDLDGYY
jgi:hypothetical protein